MTVIIKAGWCLSILKNGVSVLPVLPPLAEDTLSHLKRRGDGAEFIATHHVIVHQSNQHFIAIATGELRSLHCCNKI